MALRLIHADRDWWWKVLFGGAFWLTIIGWPVVEGHQLESIENTQRGFPTPLPRWNALGDKAVVGIFALVIDFFYFVFPLLVGGMLLFCGTLAVTLTGSGEAARVVALLAVGAMGLYIAGAWLLSASPVAKQRYVADGELAVVLGGELVRELLRQPARGIYLRARLLSLPPYVLALGLLVASFWISGRSVAGGLLIGWLALSALVYARLVTIQLYFAAGRAIQSRRFEMLQMARIKDKG